MQREMSGLKLDTAIFSPPRSARTARHRDNRAANAQQTFDPCDRRAECA
jgi:hypothetical protein